MTQRTIAEWLELCEKEPDRTVNFRPLDVCSWRGVYNEPCLLVTFGESKLSDFVQYLKRLPVESFYGYKGGSYRYTEDQLLNIETECNKYTSDQETVTRIVLGEQFKQE